MSFDTKTRNLLNQFVSDARSLLTEEFTSQFKKDFGLDPDTGEVAELERLGDIEDAQRQTAIILRDTLAHYYANLPTKSKKQEKDHQQLIERIIREQAFTILNRLCAIRMAEARDLVIESVAEGVQSKGFQLYQHIVGNSLGDTGAAYQQYLFSLFDEFAVDLPVLFDRFSPQGRLFPKETVLNQLLGLINDTEINQLWAEDETIGWIYQYFNSKEERKAMRDASQAPRNSRELAVRNQFFTPRYVVEFLTDNTLGRIWYEMRKGETRLTDECQYLVRRPNEIFLAEGECEPTALAAGDQPENSTPDTDLTQEELLNQPVHIPHRPLKDPREIRMLDPACGSMHFGLYAFDLYLKIYEEAWELHSQTPEMDDASENWRSFASFAGSYPDKAAFLRDVPRLIIEQNIHGIDIDPRAVQIAGLSLWLRAQRAWKSQGIAAGDRPQVTRSNVVCAEPMPGDQQQLEAFCKELHPAIAQMVTAIFEEMKLAGEAGSLLKIEQEISSLVAAAKKQYKDNPPDKKSQMQLFGGASAVKEQQLEFDLSGITDELFFEKAEEEIYEALRRYASESSEGGFRRKLFANDAERGFSLLNLLRGRFDVFLMNPPFGKLVTRTRTYVAKWFPEVWQDIYAAFFERFTELLEPGGLAGAITSSTYLNLSKLEGLRQRFVVKSRSNVIVELGAGVMDDATVNAVCHVFVNRLANDDCVIFAKVDSENPATELANLKDSTKLGMLSSSVFAHQMNTFHALPKVIFSYWLPRSVLALFHSLPALNKFGKSSFGLHTRGNEERLYRLWWEPADCKQFSKNWPSVKVGGKPQHFHRDHHVVVNWTNDARELKEIASRATGGTFTGKDYYFKPGISYIYTAQTTFSAQPLERGAIFSAAAHGIFLDEEADFLPMLGILNSEIVRLLLKVINPNRFFQAGYVALLPICEFEPIRDQLTELVSRSLSLSYEHLSGDELSRNFACMWGTPDSSTESPTEAASSNAQDLAAELQETKSKLDKLVADCYGLEDSDVNNLQRIIGDSTAQPIPGDVGLIKRGTEYAAECWVSFLVGCAFARWNSDEYSSLPSKIDYFEAFANRETPLDVGGYALLAAQDSQVSLPNLVRLQIDKHLKLGGNCENEFLSAINCESFESYFSDENKFFAHHLKRYSTSQREAPIYWPISTESGSYTLWFYYHRLTDQTLYKAVNDFVDPKLKETVRQLGDLRAIKDRSSAQEKELAQLTELESELEQFKADLLEIAAFWKPNLNDGVQITAAPLHKFFRLKKWRDKLAKTWKELHDGKFDWAHLALSIWPDRVVREKCTTDRSIAIAHDLEEQLWHEVEVTTVSKSGRESTKMQWMPKNLSEEELDEIVKGAANGR